VVRETVAKSKPIEEARSNIELLGHRLTVGKYLANVRKVAGRSPVAANAIGAQKLRLAPE
jgi:hypothetical protein